MPEPAVRKGARRASVGAMLRVVRLSSRTPSFISSRRTASLKLEAETPVARAIAKPTRPYYRYKGR
jgi:hypothetical protein